MDGRNGVRIAALQYDIAWTDREANFAIVTSLLEEAKEQGARFALLPEMFSTGFVMDTTIAEMVDGPSSAFLTRQAERLDMWVAGTCPERQLDDARPHNSFVVASPTGESYRYHKIHPFTHGGEDRVFRGGDRHLTIQIEGLRISLFVCYDLRFADEFWGLAPHTDCYLVPANWPETRASHWEALLRARAIENLAWVVGCNRIGTGGGLTYNGGSMMIDPWGQVVAEADDAQCVIVADIDPAVVTNLRQRYPFLNDRR